mmetsp:Transcript_29509/g.87408  ORF Transcript_29509/g.87408 Transcript_29509/m.87408 type:complete len:202 (+) Transcript_29509:556-1161(+)
MAAVGGGGRRRRRRRGPGRLRAAALSAGHGAVHVRSRRGGPAPGPPPGPGDRAGRKSVRCRFRPSHGVRAPPSLRRREERPRGGSVRVRSPLGLRHDHPPADGRQSRIANFHEGRRVDRCAPPIGFLRGELGGYAGEVDERPVPCDEAPGADGGEYGEVLGALLLRAELRRSRGVPRRVLRGGHSAEVSAHDGGGAPARKV